MKGIELVASKSYHPSGVITVTIYFQNTIYVSIMDGGKENPLLDSRFPDVAGKGRGYQIQAYDTGRRDWPELRKVSVWQTVNALEQEFRERAAQMAAEKNYQKADNMGSNSNSSAPEAVEDGSSERDDIGDLRKNLMNNLDSKNTSSSSLQGEAKSSSSSDTRDRGSPPDDPLNDTLSCSSTAQNSPDSRVEGLGYTVIVPVIADEKESSAKVRLGPGTVTRTSFKIDDHDDDRPRLSRQVSSNKDIDDDNGNDNNNTCDSSAQPRRAHSGSGVGISDTADNKISAGGSGLSVSSLGSALDSATQPSPTNGGARFEGTVARPHHIPKMADTLSKRMDEIRKTMGDVSNLTVCLSSTSHAIRCEDSTVYHLIFYVVL